MRQNRALFASAALLALPACGTQEIGPEPATHAGVDPGPDLGRLTIGFAPTADTYAQHQAQTQATFYDVYLDGGRLILDHAPAPTQVVVADGGAAGTGYLPAGPHQLAIRRPGSGSTIVAGDGDIVAGTCTEVFLFGHLDALQARWVPFPSTATPGMLHIVAINLVRDGRRIEVVDCSGGLDCTPMSPPLALGDTFAADVDTATFSPTGTGVGWRLVPTAAMPTPPVQPMLQPGAVSDSPVYVLAAPIFMSEQGSAQEEMVGCLP